MFSLEIFVALDGCFWKFKIASSDLIQFLIIEIFSAGFEHTLYKISVTMRSLENRTQRIFNNSIKQKQKLGSPVHCREPRFQRPNLRPESRNFGIPRKMMFLDLIFSLCFQISRKLGVNNNICSFLITWQMYQTGWNLILFYFNTFFWKWYPSLP